MSILSINLPDAKIV